IPDTSHTSIFFSNVPDLLKVTEMELAPACEFAAYQKSHIEGPFVDFVPAASLYVFAVEPLSVMLLTELVPVEQTPITTRFPAPSRAIEMDSLFELAAPEFVLCWTRAIEASANAAPRRKETTRLWIERRSAELLFIFITSESNS